MKGSHVLFGFLIVVMVTTSLAIVHLPVVRLELPPLLEDDVVSEALGKIPLRMKTNAYVTTVQVGPTKSNFNVQLDTGSSFFYIPSSACGPNCGSHQQYTCPGPTVGTVSARYGTGAFTGVICINEVTVGNYTVHNQAVALATQEDPFLRSDDFDGILGLGFPLLSTYTALDGTTRIANPLFDNLAAQYPIRKIFSFYMTPFAYGEGSFMTIAESDPSYYEGDIIYVPVSPDILIDGSSAFRYWQVPLMSFNLGGYEFLESPTHILIDSGTSDIVVPHRVLQTIVRTLGLPPLKASGGVTYPPEIPCNAVPRLPVLRMAFGLVGFVLEPQDYVVLEKGVCSIEMVSLTYGLQRYIVGDSFFRKYYIEFDLDNHRIGFARSKHFQGGSIEAAAQAPTLPAPISTPSAPIPTPPVPIPTTSPSTPAAIYDAAEEQLPYENSLDEPIRGV